MNVAITIVLIYVAALQTWGVWQNRQNRARAKAIVVDGNVSGTVDPQVAEIFRQRIHAIASNAGDRYHAVDMATGASD